MTHSISPDTLDSIAATSALEQAPLLQSDLQSYLRLMTRKQEAKPGAWQAPTLGTITAYLENTNDSVQHLRKMAMHAEVTRASHGPMLAQQIEATRQALAQLIAFAALIEEA